MRSVNGSTNLSLAEHTTQKATHPFRLPAVDRAISLFELLAASEHGMTLSELSRKLNMPKSTAHYLIYTLATRGYVQRTTKGRYSLGLGFSRLAAASTAEQDLRNLVIPYLRKIVARLNLTAALTILRGSESVVIGTVSSARGGGGGAWVGRHIDLHCNAQGKALIAFLPGAELDKIFAGREFAPFTPKTILSLPALKLHLEEVRARGYAVCNEEYFHGFRAVAAPVFDALHGVISAISVRGSSREIPSSRFGEIGEELIRVSREITAQLRRY